MDRSIPDVIAWKRGFEELEELRRQRIRESSIIVDAPILEDALESARYLGHKKAPTGLGELANLLEKMYR